jgi:hypothetical protein
MVPASELVYKKLKKPKIAGSHDSTVCSLQGGFISLDNLALASVSANNI